MLRLAPTSRRRALGAALGVGLLGSGCSLGSLDPSPADPTLSPSGAAPSSPGDQPDQPDGDPDAALLDAAAVEVSRAHDVVRTSIRLHPEQAGVLSPIERLHRAHARELGGLRPVTGTAGSPRESARQVRARVVRAEVALQRSLVRDATRAESGALALLLASIAAASAQARTTL